MYDQITKARKMVKANNASSCGNAIAEYRDNIVILEHGTNFRKYVIPKSKVERYDGTDIYLSIPLLGCNVNPNDRLFLKQNINNNQRPDNGNENNNSG